MAASSSAAALFAPECLLYSTASSSSLVGSMGLTSLSAPSSTSALLSFKGLADPPFHSVSFIPTSSNSSISGTGGLVFQLENNKAALNVYSWQRDHPLQRIILPQKLSCIACSPDGELIAAGSFDGRILLWHVATGDLLCSFDAHFRSVTVLRWSTDGSALVTGSEDARILVWSLPGLLAPQDQTSSSITSSEHAPAPYCTLADHNLAITDLHISGSRFPNHTTILSSSSDGTVKLWDTRTRSLLSTFTFEHPIARIAMDATERFFFATAAPASGKNLVYRVDLFRKKPHSGARATSTGKDAASSGSYDFTTDELRGLTSVEARGFGGLGHTDRISSTEPTSGTNVIELKEPPTSLCLSLNSTLLCVGTSAGNLFVIDVANSQILRSVSLLGNAKSSSITGHNAVTNLQVLAKPRDLAGSWEASSGANVPVRPTANLSRKPLADEDDRGMTPYPTRMGGCSFDVDSHIDPVWDSNLVPDSASMFTPALASASVSVSTSDSRAQTATTTAKKPHTPSSHDFDRLNSQVDLLKAQLAKAKAFNDEMWTRLVQDRLAGTHADDNNHDE
ncbi:WD40 repeat-like protein [Testicularia cyperi]|uniref:Pre-rRNA-processing protein IPI3 n=1 Tax=Testicularia cyperi TaxID=1882483 RepID=A0A317XY82_9BASI|nr:WD40 repeat-like protein [Testicularia cyperi]